MYQCIPYVGVAFGRTLALSGQVGPRRVCVHAVQSQAGRRVGFRLQWAAGCRVGGGTALNGSASCCSEARNRSCEQG